MNFRQACELSKMNPGSTVQRNESGDFVVLDADGHSNEQIGQPRKETQPAARNNSDCADLETLKKALEAAQSEAAHLRAVFDSANEGAKYEISKSGKWRSKYEELQHQYDRMQKQYNEVKSKHEEMLNQLNQLQSKLDLISNAEWKTIQERIQKEKDDYSKELRGKRVLMKCPCSGEVENCARCYGAGEYTVDGYGNRV